MDVGVGVFDAGLDEDREQVVRRVLPSLDDQRRDVLRDRGRVPEHVAVRRHADRPVEELRWSSPGRPSATPIVCTGTFGATSS